MFVGHYGPAYAAKKADPDLPLGLLCLTTQLPDILWATLTLLGVEQAEVAPELPSNPYRYTRFPYSHSLPSALGLAAAAYGVGRLRAPRAARALGSIILSHWALDLLVHRPDMPLWANTRKVGLGVWDRPYTAYVVEALSLLGGLVAYTRATTPSTRAGAYGPGLFGAALLAFNALTFRLPPPTIKAGALMNLSSYLTLAGVSAWLDTQRTAQPKPAGAVL